MKAKITKALIIVLFITAILYLPASFINLTFNPALWPQNGRAFVAIFWAVFVPFAVIGVLFIDNSNE